VLSKVLSGKVMIVSLDRYENYGPICIHDIPPVIAPVSASTQSITKPCSILRYSAQYNLISVFALPGIYRKAFIVSPPLDSGIIFAARGRCFFSRYICIARLNDSFGLLVVTFIFDDAKECIVIDCILPLSMHIPADEFSIFIPL
jgi:hypothetical protein